MAAKIVPYNNAMRLGQGFNSYTQQICIDDAVVIDPDRAENVITNDGTSMRILADKSAQPSVWNRQPEVVNDDRASAALHTDKALQSAEDPGGKTEEKHAFDAGDDTAHAGQKHEEAASETPAIQWEQSDSGSGENITHEEANGNEDTLHEPRASYIPGGFATPQQRPEPTQAATTAAGATKAEPEVKKANASGTGSSLKDTLHKAESRPKTREDKRKEAAMERKEERQRELDERRKAEQRKIENRRKYEEEKAEEDRAEERQRRAEDRAEAQKMREEKRRLAEQRREEMRAAIKDAADLKATSLEKLQKIAAQNQFADRFTGILEPKTECVFDPNGSRGPSQTVSYTSRFVDRLSDVTEDLCVSGSLSIKAGKIGGSGKGSFVDSDKFKQSDLNFYISVKVVNQTINFKDALVYNPVRSVTADNFKNIFGDSFIAGFVEGGEFNALVSMKILNKAKKTDIQAEAKVALTVGPVDLEAQANVGIARSNLETNTETTIQVSWSGGGHIKPMEQQWDIPSLMQAAARFPDLVADCPQRTYAILGRYETLRSFVAKAPAACTPLQYENAQIYTNALLDSFMSYKALYKTIGENIFAIQGKTLEIKKRVNDVNSKVPAQNSGDETNEDESKKATDKKTGSKDPKTGLFPYVEDRTPFEDSLEGLSDARIAIRRQMARIVNEVDIIEHDPKVATDEDHNEPFQSPLDFETRLPAVEIPARLRPRSSPLTGASMRPPTLTPDEAAKQEQEEQDAINAPPLNGAGVTLAPEEATMFDTLRMTRPGIGTMMRVTTAVGSQTAGKLFNNLDILQPLTPPEWVVTQIQVHVYKGYISYIGSSYNNGLIIGKGVKHNDATSFPFGPFEFGERITSASIETGIRSSDADKQPRLTAIGLFTNRGRSFLATAPTEAKAQGAYSKDGVLFNTIDVVNVEVPFERATVKGFFGRSDDDQNGEGCIWRLGLLWGRPAPGTPEAKPDTKQECKPLAVSSISSMVKEPTGPQSAEFYAEGKDWKMDMNFIWRGAIKFQPAYSEPPTVISGLSNLDTQSNKRWHADTRHMNVTKDQATGVCRADGEGHYQMHLRWLAIPKTDKHIETGVYEFSGDEGSFGNAPWVGKQAYIPFSKPFASPPTIVNWLCDLETGPGYYSASTGSNDLTKDGFKVNLVATKESGSENRTLAGRRVGWFAYDPIECCDIRSGNITGVVSAGKREVFSRSLPKTLVVWAALRYVEASAGHNLRLHIGLQNIKEDGFDYNAGNWSVETDQEMKGFRYTYIAISGI